MTFDYFFYINIVKVDTYTANTAHWKIEVKHQNIVYDFSL